jgi:hypothetical protein
MPFLVLGAIIAAIIFILFGTRRPAPLVAEFEVSSLITCPGGSIDLTWNTNADTTILSADAPVTNLRGAADPISNPGGITVPSRSARRVRISRATQFTLEIRRSGLPAEFRFGSVRDVIQDNEERFYPGIAECREVQIPGIPTGIYWVHDIPFDTSRWDVDVKVRRIRLADFTPPDVGVYHNGHEWLTPPQRERLLSDTPQVRGQIRVILRHEQGEPCNPNEPGYQPHYFGIHLTFAC